MPGERLIYMDNHATTRCDPRVVEAMLPYFTEAYGNPGSTHGFGTEAAEVVRRARALVASFIGARPEEVVFTSGATESNNLALRGVMLHPRRKGTRLVSVTTEHESVLEPIRNLAASGIKTHLMGVRPHGDPRAGEVELDVVGEAVDGDTALVSVMLANNEIGAIQPIRQIADLCHQHGALLHCDATQAVGKVPVDVRQLGVDLMSFSGHKVYGPAGIGGLYVRGGAPRVRLQPAITGGGQQEGRRSGTLNTPAIVGLAEALRLCQEEMDSEPARLAELRDALWAELAERIPGVELCGPDLALGAESRLPGNLCVTIPGVDSESLLLQTRNLAASSGAACATSSAGPSHVLLALGMSETQARGGLRLGLGRFNRREDVRVAAAEITAALGRLQSQ